MPVPAFDSLEDAVEFLKRQDAHWAKIDARSSIRFYKGEHIYGETGRFKDRDLKLSDGRWRLEDRWYDSQYRERYPFIHIDHVVDYYEASYAATEME